ncbi:MAG: hypothetical protein PHR86_07005, partial [Desulfobacterales bacterium]|nr:hypothetical protein [Desulfobacterales bacterium]
RAFPNRFKFFNTLRRIVKSRVKISGAGAINFDGFVKSQNSDVNAESSDSRLRRINKIGWPAVKIRGGSDCFA